MIIDFLQFFQSMIRIYDDGLLLLIQTVLLPTLKISGNIMVYFGKGIQQRYSGICLMDLLFLEIRFVIFSMPLSTG